MVLFDSDFISQGALPDSTTKNVTFIRMHRILLNLGIRNNRFFLALHDQTLKGIDPHNLGVHDTPEVKLRIIRECRINPWYALREVIRVPKQGTEGTPFELNRANLAIFWLFLNNVDVMSTIPRQCGKTISVTTLFTICTYLMGLNICLGLFARESKLVQENVQRIKWCRDGLPKYFVAGSGDDTDNKEGIVYAALNNSIKTYTAAHELQRAKEHAKGESFAVEWFDELGFFKNIKDSWTSAISAVSAAQPQARLSGMPCANVYTTTAANPMTESGRFAYQMRRDALPFCDNLYDLANAAELRRALETGSRNMVCYVEYSWRQLGKSESWFKEWQVRLANDPDTFKRDICNQWLVSEEDSVLPKETIEILQDHIVSPMYVEWLDAIQLRWYVPKEVVESAEFRKRPLVLGMDMSDNMGRDYTTMVGVDTIDMSTLVTFRSNNTGQLYVARSIARFMQLFHRTILVPERNRQGAAIIEFIVDELMRMKQNPFRRIFNYIVQNYRSLANPINLNRADPNLMTNRKEFGFLTTSGKNSRDLLYKQVLYEAVRRNAKRIHDGNLIDELCTLSMRNGRVDHSASGNDDLVIAYLLANWFILHGRELHLYGIEPHEFLSRVSDDGNEVDPAVRDQQNRYREEIKRLEQQMAATKSDFMKCGYRMRLKELQALIDPTLAEPEQIAVSQVAEPTLHVGETRHRMEVDAMTKLFNRANMSMF